MSIERINRQSYINSYNSNCNKVTDRAIKPKNVDRVEISELGKSLTDYTLDTNIDNSKKLAEIRSKIQSGIYNIDAKLTATSILNVIKESKL